MMLVYRFSGGFSSALEFGSIFNVIIKSSYGTVTLTAKN